MIFEIDVEVYKSIKGLVSGMGECALLRSQLVVDVGDVASTAQDIGIGHDLHLLALGYEPCTPGG